MGIKVFKPMIRPMTDQPVDVDLFTSIYNAISSLNISDIDYVIDNWAEPWGSPKGSGNVVAAKSSSGLQLKIVAGYVPVHDGSSKRRSGKRSWTIAFPSSSSFTVPPVVVANAVFTGKAAEPVATSIQWASTKHFRIHAQSIDNHTINISHFSYIAMGY